MINNNNNNNIESDNINVLTDLPAELQFTIWRQLDTADLCYLHGTCKNLFYSPILIQELINRLNKFLLKIVVGYYGTFRLMRNGTVLGCGLNNRGQLGLGDTNDRSTPVEINLPSKVKDVFAGSEQTFFLLEDGSVFGCGRNTHGLLGLGHTTNQLTPVQIIPILGKVKAVATSGAHTIFLMEDGTVFGCGRNDEGQLGLGDTNNRSTPVKIHIPTQSKVKTVAAGRYHTIFLTEDGSVFGCGSNHYCQLGLGDTNDRSTPVEINLPGKVKTVISENFQTFFLLEDGSVWGCGLNENHLLGLGHTNDQVTPVKIFISGKVKTVAVGYNQVFFLTENGTLFVNLSSGQLIPIHISGIENVATKANCTIVSTSGGNTFKLKKIKSTKFSLLHIGSVSNPRINKAIESLKDRLNDIELKEEQRLIRHQELMDLLVPPNTEFTLFGKVME